MSDKETDVWNKRFQRQQPRNFHKDCEIRDKSNKNVNNNFKNDKSSSSQDESWRHVSSTSGLSDEISQDYTTSGQNIAVSQNCYTSDKMDLGKSRSLDKQYYVKSRVSDPKLRSSVVTRNRIPVIKTLVQNIDLDFVKPRRAGVIIYTTVNGSIYFGLGLDARSHDLTDFGGTVIYKIDRNVINGALREFQEETLEIFEQITYDDIKKFPVIYDENNLIIFVHLNVNPDDICSVFNEKYRRTVDINNRMNETMNETMNSPNFYTMSTEKQQPINTNNRINGKKYRNYNNYHDPRDPWDPEVCGITWLSWEDFQNSINKKGIIFSRVQRFLLRAGDFSYLL
jgi:hypothetical protein